VFCINNQQQQCHHGQENLQKRTFMALKDSCHDIPYHGIALNFFAVGDGGCVHIMGAFLVSRVAY
jgi:hypothetical protein